MVNLTVTYPKQLVMPSSMVLEFLLSKIFPFHSFLFFTILKNWTFVNSILSFKISNILSANEKRALRKKLLIAQKLTNQYRDEIKQNSHGQERTKVSCKSVATRTNLSDLQTRPHRTVLVTRLWFQKWNIRTKSDGSIRTEPWIPGRILMI